MADGGRFDRELEGIPQAQKGPPRWMFFAGCGCLVPGFILVIVMWFTYQMIRELVDQKTAWEALADVVAFDDAARGTPSGEEDDLRTPQDESWDPPEFELVFGGPIPFSGGLEAYWFGRDIRGPLDPEGEYGENAMLVTFLKTKSDQAEAATEAPPGTPLHEDMTLEVQGRALRGRRIPEMVSDDLLMQASGLDEVRGAGAALWLREGFTDPNEEGESFDLLVFFQRPNSSDPIRDEEMRSFLEPFDVA
ncbi:MAG: hypothetical protein AAGA20_21245, partial [Planctomycetota bacterium]